MTSAQLATTKRQAVHYEQLYKTANAALQEVNKDLMKAKQDLQSKELDIKAREEALKEREAKVGTCPYCAAGVSLTHLTDAETAKPERSFTCTCQGSCSTGCECRTC